MAVAALLTGLQQAHPGHARHSFQQARPHQARQHHVRHEIVRRETAPTREYRELSVRSRAVHRHVRPRFRRLREPERVREDGRIRVLRPDGRAEWLTFDSVRRRATSYLPERPDLPEDGYVIPGSDE